MPDGKNGDCRSVLDFEEGDVARRAKRNDEFPQKRVVRIRLAAGEGSLENGVVENGVGVYRWRSTK